MKQLIRTAAIALVSLPLVAMAQTSTTMPSTTTGTSKVQNAETPRSNMEQQQTQQNGDAPKYGETGSSTSSQMNHKDSTKTHKMKKSTTPSDSTTTTNTTPDTTTK
jgi:hypothetical protein